MVDSLASGASARKGVRVRLPPRAPQERHVSKRVFLFLFSIPCIKNRRPPRSHPFLLSRKIFLFFPLDESDPICYHSAVRLSDTSSLVSDEELVSSTPPCCTSGGIGRLAGFRCQCSQGRAGSTPASCTTRKTRFKRVFLFLSVALLPPGRSAFFAFWPVLQLFSNFVVSALDGSGSVCYHASECVRKEPCK